MDCILGVQLNHEFAKATIALSVYEESLKGMAPTPEQRKESERLASGFWQAGRAHTAHVDQCAECSLEKEWVVERFHDCC